MAGNLTAKERAGVTLTSAGSSMTSGSYAAVGSDLDVRASGNAADDLLCRFELTCQWGTPPAANITACDIYLLPKLDGTNLPAFDTTSGAAILPFSCLAGAFPITKAPTASTDTRFVSAVIELFPLLYTVHLVNKSGQTISANWTLKVVSAQAQYT